MLRDLRDPAGTLGAALTVFVASACTVAETPTLELGLEELGRELFTQETFEGNGRVCSTCHELEQFGTITPEFVRERFEEDPEDPLFRTIDSDDGVGNSYERLIEHATVRVPIEVATHERSGLSVRKCDAPTETTVVLHRGNPNVFNLALEPFVMVDGREGDDLEEQARNAIITHAEPGRDPTPEELAAIAAFQESLFSHAAVHAFLASGEVPSLPGGTTPAEVRGRAFFEPDRQCGICHAGPMLNETSADHPNVEGFRFETDLVGAEPDNPNEKSDWCFVDPETNEVVPGPTGDTAVFSMPVADPGIAILAGSKTATLADGTREVFPNEILSGLVGGPTFKIPTLWGTPNTPPYFHDNSAKDLDEVLDQYNFMFDALEEFAIDAGCDRDAPECLSEQDKADIIAFMQLLSFEKSAEPAGRR